MHPPPHAFCPLGHDSPVVWVAACFLAFLRHLFLAWPDFFLHLAFRSWAALSSLSCQPRMPSVAARGARRARRREPAAPWEPARASNRESSMDADLDAC